MTVNLKNVSLGVMYAAAHENLCKFDFMQYTCTFTFVLSFYDE